MAVARDDGSAGTARSGTARHRSRGSSRRRSDRRSRAAQPGSARRRSTAEVPRRPGTSGDPAGVGRLVWIVPLSSLSAVWASCRAGPTGPRRREVGATSRRETAVVMSPSASRAARANGPNRSTAILPPEGVSPVGPPGISAAASASTIVASAAMEADSEMALIASLVRPMIGSHPTARTTGPFARSSARANSWRPARNDSDAARASPARRASRPRSITARACDSSSLMPRIAAIRERASRPATAATTSPPASTARRRRRVFPDRVSAACSPRSAETVVPR